jgi:uncharacterized protein YndB with AHSA1/START domain
MAATALTANETTISEADREVVITRVFDAPARLLFAAFSKPEHLLKWFGPGDYPLSLCEVDFRVGGRFRFAMTGPSGVEETPFGGEYREIVPNREIVFDNGFLAEGAGRMVVTVTFEETGGRTKLTVQTVFDSKETYDFHVGQGFAQGFGIALDQLAAHLAQVRA